jgi:hypothetical protein
MDVTDLRIALFTGNYNYVRDGANQALNRLVEYLLRRGAQVRIYSPTVDEPALPPMGEVVNVPQCPSPAERNISSRSACPAREAGHRGLPAQHLPCRKP